MTFAILFIARIVVGLFCLLTAAYSVLNCSPFAFDMFVRPQLIPSLSQFVVWHHLSLGVMYLVSLVSIAPELDWRRRSVGRQKAARWLAAAYVVAFGVFTASQQLSPFLPTLWNDDRAVPTVLVALLPLVWLAAIDYLSVDAQTLAEENAAWQPFGQRRLLLTCAGVAGYLWIAHVLRALTHGDRTGGVAVWAITGVWTLALTAATFALVYTVSSLIAALAPL